MERIEALIQKLKQQYEQQADPSLLLGTVELLRFELAGLQKSSNQSGLGTAKVAVILPVTQSAVSESVPAGYEKYMPATAKAEVVEVPVEVKTAVLPEQPVPPVPKKGQLDMAFDPMTEIPTLSQQQPKKELNDRVPAGSASLNDQLKEVKTELMEVLKETPVKDLRKAIGINDRFLFINELFRGDEAIYERSIRTINNFNLYAEAEFWISRELKTKLGWVTDSEAVQHFDQLVRRRFS